ncbi:ArsR family transcriptional regulator [Mucilaginibacter sp. ZT4R22]|uniref:ArsR family transcriptional regulator n=1 Tax=Mucilaginibacter pankratovii TaxID=2772110 RepID=A0ABR7WQE8_9SPHI|nr:helix-turn-helix transcriptional regulator [Mucilaginibacter pankratovii]MBD1364550.1 ArsR family transcriptional regulator [Mucilaginibacter pankratovii]
MGEEEFATEFSKQEVQIADFMRAMAHPARIAIMIRLAKFNTCLKKDVVPNIPVQNSSLKKHLLALEYAGLIKGMTSVHHADYCINWEAFGEFARTFKAFFDEFDFKNVQQNCQARKGRRKRIFNNT